MLIGQDCFRSRYGCSYFISAPFSVPPSSSLSPGCWWVIRKQTTHVNYKPAQVRETIKAEKRCPGKLCRNFTNGREVRLGADVWNTWLENAARCCRLPGTVWDTWTAGNRQHPLHLPGAEGNCGLHDIFPLNLLSVKGYFQL